MPKREIWLVGDWTAKAFDAPRRWLSTLGACRLLASVSETQRLRPADTAIVAQARPGELQGQDVELLSRSAPETRLVVLDGPWCEGEHRPVQPLIRAKRVPWRRWREGLELALLEEDGGKQIHTEVKDEKSLAAAELERSLQAAARCRWPGRRAAVWTERRDIFSSLVDALGVFSLEALWLGGSGRFTGGADVLIYDGWRYVLPLPVNKRAPGVHPRGSELSAGRLLLVDFPRPDDGLAASDFGIDAILPLPLRVADLAAVLSRLLGRYESTSVGAVP